MNNDKDRINTNQGKNMVNIGKELKKQSQEIKLNSEAVESLIQDNERRKKKIYLITFYF